MRDKDNYKEILAARLKEIHLAETAPQTLPTDEDLMRWERLANMRRAEKRRKFRAALSIAAVFLLAVVIGITAVVGPPEVEAGGEGKAAIRDKTTDKDYEIDTYTSIEAVPNDVKEAFWFFDIRKYNIGVEEIIYKELKNNAQVDIKYTYSGTEVIEVSQVKGKNEAPYVNNLYAIEKSDVWGEKSVYIVNDTEDGSKKAYYFLHRDILVSIYCNEKFEPLLRKIIEGTI